MDDATGRKADDAPPLSLAAKLTILRAMQCEADGREPTLRELAQATAPYPGAKAALSTGAWSDLLSGATNNPSSSTIGSLAQALGCPPAFLLPGWDGLASLSIYWAQPEARRALRTISGLGEEGAALLAAAADRIREELAGGTPPPAETPDLPVAAESNTRGRPRTRKRLSFDDAARRAAEDLEEQ
jgi:transcriptional regulator with XRE-family HTH domain